jgi:hypothetical protein
MLRLLIALTLLLLTLSQEYPYRCKKEDRMIGRLCINQTVPVCGHYYPRIKCVRAPCGETSDNICTACKNPNVQFVTKGAC